MPDPVLTPLNIFNLLTTLPGTCAIIFTLWKKKLRHRQLKNLHKFKNMENTWFKPQVWH